MAQTKNKRFKEQKRAQRKPAPQPVAASKKAPSDSGGGNKKLLVGGGIAAALAAAAAAFVIVANPFAGPSPEASKPTVTRPAPTEMSASLARITMIRDYRAVVETKVAEQIAAGCKSGAPVSANVRIRGAETPVTITCKGISLQVVDAKTKKVMPSRVTS